MSNRLTIKNAHAERQLFGKRVIVIGIGIALLAIALFSRLAYLQIYQQSVYTTLARQNLLNLLPAEPNRGLIYDRNGTLLAENHPVFNLVVTASRVPNLKATLAALQKIIPISNDDLQQFNKQLNLQRRFAPLVLHSKLKEEEVARFSVQQYRFPGVSIQAQMIRHYPLGATFSQVLGYVGRINADELQEVDSSNYSATNFIGKTGVEKYYESTLHGTVGFQQAEMDATGKLVRIVNYTPPIPGESLYLTLNSKLQAAIEKILGDKMGAVVAIDPRNGDILALVSNPSYDPNLFVTGISKNDYQHLTTAPGQPLYNRALHGRYPPGSTIKPFLGLAGLATGIVNADASTSCPGWFKLKTSSHIYHDWQRKGHGTVNLARAIRVSCDTYFYNLSVKLGIERMSDVLKQFGFGQLTGIDLDNESTGIVPCPEWKKRVHNRSWYPGDTLITGIGQGFMLATPLQLATATATLANRGQRIQPHILLKSKAPDGSIKIMQPTTLPPVVLDDKMWDLVLNAMQGVTQSPEGTAYAYFHGAPYTVAAKTGTAQVFSLKKNQKDKANLLPEKLRDNSLFIAYAPVDTPRIAIAVMLQHSSIPASSIAREVLDAYLVKKS